MGGAPSSPLGHLPVFQGSAYGRRPPELTEERIASRGCPGPVELRNGAGRGPVSFLEPRKRITAAPTGVSS